MRVRLVGVAFLKVIERSGNGGNANEENNKIHDDLLLKKTAREAKKRRIRHGLAQIFSYHSGKKQARQALSPLCRECQPPGGKAASGDIVLDAGLAAFFTGLPFEAFQPIMGKTFKEGFDEQPSRSFGNVIR